MNRTKTWKPLTGGILSIIAGVSNLLAVLFVSLAFGYYTVTSYPGSGMYTMPMSNIGNIWFFITPLVVLSIVAIIGGIYALIRKSWGMALAGAICAIFSPVTWHFGIAATVLIAISQDEFKNPDYGLPPVQTPPSTTPPSQPQ